ncbi:MAG: gamma-glutamyl-gamma-aminobutyrate hydrolase family protein, partial [Microterricola sp.]
DGVIEAVELPSVPFGVAVQWHPEENAEDRRLFAGLVVAAGKYASQKQPQCHDEHQRQKEQQ